MTTETHRAVIVKISPAERSCWYVTDDAGVVYRTFNQWMASLAGEYLAKGVLLVITFHHGWQHRDLQSLQPVVAAERPMMVECSWCQRVVSDGTRPATSTICPACMEKMNQQLADKYGYGWGV